MNPILFSLGTITGLFFIFLLFKKVLKKEFCVLCAAVSLTWISLLFIYYGGLFQDKVIIAILMGQTSMGIFYLLEKKVSKEITIFRLPFLLALTLSLYALISWATAFKEIISSLFLLISIWAIFIGIFLFRNNKWFGKLITKLVECCKRW